MRLMPAQVAMLLFTGSNAPRLGNGTIEERILEGHNQLKRITSRDFGFDLLAWHSFLVESNSGGYCFENRHVNLKNEIDKAISDYLWLEIAQKLG